MKKIVAFIPVRGGSKSIPLKNIKIMAGKPLVYWAIKAANECKYIDKIYVSTDSEKISYVVNTFGFEKAEVIQRSEKVSTDTASTESVMLEFAENYDFDDVILIQATSPLLSSDDLSGGIKLYTQDNTDSVLSVVRQKRFIWNINDDGIGTPLNYDCLSRPRRQEFDGFLVENGAFYITSKERLLKTKCRISGITKPYEMDSSTYFEIDEPSDWLIIEQQLKERLLRNKNEIIPQIKMFLMDCDGVLTDGGMYYSENGDELKRFNTTDGMGIKLLKETGVIVGIITGEKRELNKRRAKKLNVDILEQGVADKLSVVKSLCKEYHISINNVLYIGDDVNDLEVIESVGFGCSVANGQNIVKKAAKYVTKKRGGEGAVREIIDYIMKEK